MTQVPVSDGGTKLRGSKALTPGRLPAALSARGEMKDAWRTTPLPPIRSCLNKGASVFNRIAVDQCVWGPRPSCSVACVGHPKDLKKRTSRTSLIGQQLPVGRVVQERTFVGPGITELPRRRGTGGLAKL
jgi:hypothetical protein